MNNAQFNVVIIDDKKSTCQRICEKISGAQVSLPDGTNVTIFAKFIHIKVCRENINSLPEEDSWTFSEEILSDIVEATKDKADMLIVDYIYIDGSVAKYFKEKAKNKTVDDTDIAKRALNPLELYQWFNSLTSLKDKEKNRVIQNLFHSKCSVYLHSYTPQGLYAASGSMEQRKRKAATAFPQASLHVIDTRSELFNDDEFDWPSPSKYDSSYYPYQLAVLFDQITHKEVFKHLFKEKRLLNKVFVVHGRNEAIKEGVARFLEKAGTEAIVLHEQPSKGKTIIEKFTHYSDVGFAIILLTADDKGGLKTEAAENYKPRARQNVILELGYFLGLLGRERVCALYEEGVDIPSDYSGVLFIPIDENGAWRFLLARELKEVGFPIDLNKVF